MAVGVCSKRPAVFKQRVGFRGLSYHPHNGLGGCKYLLYKDLWRPPCLWVYAAAIICYKTLYNKDCYEAILVKYKGTSKTHFFLLTHPVCSRRIIPKFRSCSYLFCYTCFGLSALHKLMFQIIANGSYNLRAYSSATVLIHSLPIAKVLRIKSLRIFLLTISQLRIYQVVFLFCPRGNRPSLTAPQRLCAMAKLSPLLRKSDLKAVIEYSLQAG